MTGPILATHPLIPNPHGAPVIQIKMLKTRYKSTTRQIGLLTFEKAHFSHFLRVYNRRSKHTPGYITSLGYRRVALLLITSIEAKHWCQENLQPGSWVYNFSAFWFAYDADATMFAMRWL